MPRKQLRLKLGDRRGTPEGTVLHSVALRTGWYPYRSGLNWLWIKPDWRQLELLPLPVGDLGVNPVVRRDAETEGFPDASPPADVSLRDHRVPS